MCMKITMHTMEWSGIVAISAVLESECAGNPLEEKHSTEGDWRDQALNV